MNIENICGYCGGGGRKSNYNCCNDPGSGYNSDRNPGPTRLYESGPGLPYSDKDTEPTF